MLGGVAWFRGESNGGHWRGRELAGVSGSGAGARGVIMACSGLALLGGSEQRRRAAFIASTRRSCSGAGRPPSAGSVRQSTTKPSLIAGFHVDQTPNPWSISSHRLNQNCSSMYQLPFLFKELVPMPNRTRVISSQRSAVSTVRVQDLEKFLKC